MHPMSDRADAPASGTAAPSAQQQPSRAPMAMKYYIIQAYSGYENKVKASLQERIKNAGLEKSFGEILVPSENVQTSRAGRQRVESRKFYPGYVFVQMEMTEQTWHL